MGEDGKLVKMGGLNTVSLATHNYKGEMYIQSEVLESKDGGKSWALISWDAIMR